MPTDLKYATVTIIAPIMQGMLTKGYLMTMSIRYQPSPDCKSAYLKFKGTAVLFKWLAILVTGVARANFIFNKNIFFLLRTNINILAKEKK